MVAYYIYFYISIYGEDGPESILWSVITRYHKTHQKDRKLKRKNKAKINLHILYPVIQVPLYDRMVTEAGEMQRNCGFQS